MQFQKEPIPEALTIEDRLIDDFLGDDVSLCGLRAAKGLLHQRGIQGVSEIRVIICDDEIEEGFELSVSVVFGGLCVVLCDDFEEMKEIFGGYRSEVAGEDLRKKW